MLARAGTAKRHKPPLRDWVLSHGRMLGRLARRFPGWLVNVGSTNALTRLILDKFGVDARAHARVRASELHRNGWATTTRC